MDQMRESEEESREATDGHRYIRRSRSSCLRRDSVAGRDDRRRNLGRERRFNKWIGAVLRSGHPEPEVKDLVGFSNVNGAVTDTAIDTFALT